jgi:hypothetical protein
LLLGGLKQVIQGEGAREALLKRQRWAEKYGLRQSRKSPYCVCRLLGKSCQVYGSGLCEHAVPEADHPTLWLRHGKPFVFVSQPYQISDPERLGLFCRKRALHCVIRTWPAWHFPGAVLHVEISRDKCWEPSTEWKALRGLAGKR